MLGTGTTCFCKTIQTERAVVIHLKSLTDDTIIGYDCDYPYCYQYLCTLPKEYPVGQSLTVCQKKKDHSND
jgi:hypothetical protein